jgi:hypothetical protein
MALAALYADGSEGVQRQLIEKAQALLGKSRTFRKQFAQLCVCRTMLANGTLPFSGKYPPPATAGPPPDYDERYGEALLTATGVLAATLQRLVTKRWYELRFKYSVSSPGEAGGS